MWVTAYTDASFRNNKSAWSIWLRSEKGRVVKAGTCPANQVSNNGAAEMWAVKEAVEIALKEWPDTTGIQINSDSMLVVEGLWPWKRKSKNPEIRKIQDSIQKTISPKVMIQTKFVKGHQPNLNSNRSYLNNQVDRLAGKLTRPSKPGLKPRDTPSPSTGTGYVRSL